MAFSQIMIIVTSGRSVEDYLKANVHHKTLRIEFFCMFIGKQLNPKIMINVKKIVSITKLVYELGVILGGHKFYVIIFQVF